MVETETINNFSSIFSKMLGIIKISPIPKKKTTDRFTEKVLNKRMRGFEVYQF
jgi:hypothetical protein